MFHKIIADAKTMIDIDCQQAGGYAVLIARNMAGEDWLVENVAYDDDAAAIYGGVPVEPRYVDDILIGAWNDGLSIGIRGDIVKPDDEYL